MTTTRDDSPSAELPGATDLTALDRELRLCSWTYTDLAHAAGLNRKTIYNLRQRPETISETTWRKIARAILAREREDPDLIATMAKIRGEDAE